MNLISNCFQWKWVANTLNPYHEGNSPSNMISDDRFMFHTLDNWHFGVDNTGNLMDWDNSQAIVNKAKSLGKVFTFFGLASVGGDREISFQAAYIGVVMLSITKLSSNI